jgi:hypothetical protein
LRDALANELSLVQRTFRQDQDQKLEMRRQQISAHFNRRISDQRRRIETAENNRVKEGQLKGFRKRLSDLEFMRDDQLAKIEAKASALTESIAEVACGFIEIQAG